jgi:hypothetical protein
MLSVEHVYSLKGEGKRKENREHVLQLLSNMTYSECGGSSEQNMIATLPQLGLQNGKHFDPVQIESFLHIDTNSLY